MSQNQAMDRLLQTPITDKSGKMNLEWHRWYRDIDAKTRPILTVLGQLAANTTIAGQSGTLAQKTQNINTMGQVTPQGIGFNVDNVPDGVQRVAVSPTQKTGAQRASQALDQNNRLVSTANLTANTASATPANGATPLSAATGGVANNATINIAAFPMQFPFGVVNYNSGTITGLLDNTVYYVTAFDPTFSGGAVTYTASVNNASITRLDGLVYIGAVTTPTFGGGGTTGRGGGGGPCFSANTLVCTDRGLKPISMFQVGDWVLTLEGPRQVSDVLIHAYYGEMHKMERTGELVTPEHRIRSGSEWVAAKTIWLDTCMFAGDVFNLHVAADSRYDGERNYMLGNGRFAHNFIKQ